MMLDKFVQESVLFVQHHIVKTDAGANKYLFHTGEITKFTQKSIEAVEGSEKLAIEYGNQEIEQERSTLTILKL